MSNEVKLPRGIRNNNPLNIISDYQVTSGKDK